MRMTRIPELLKLPARPAARILSLWYIGDVEIAITRLQMQGDDAGVIQFYRALRRVHDSLRAYAAVLNSSISKKQARALADIVRAARKSVHASTLLKFVQELPLDPDEREAAEKFTQDLRDDYAKTVEDALELPERFESLRNRWRKSLRSFKVRIDPDEIPTVEIFDAVALLAVTKAAGKLERALDQLTEVDDGDALSKATGATQRLLNVIEPVRSISAAFADSVRGLNQLESLLLEITAANAAITAASEAGQPQRVLELCELSRSRLFVDLQRMWLLDNHKWFFQRLYKAGDFTSPQAAARPDYQRAPARVASPLRAPSAV